jgi:FKBP-type peptidyl-prolyl cis-trans isomerase 2
MLFSLEEHLDNELIGRTLDLDLGSTPVNMTIKEITETKVIVEYNRSAPGRTEEFNISDFEYLSGLKIKKD